MIFLSVEEKKRHLKKFILCGTPGPDTGVWGIWGHVSTVGKFWCDFVFVSNL